MSHLEITDETTRLFKGVVSVKREVHVGLGASRKNRRSEDLKLKQKRQQKENFFVWF